jgi:hypothetical protein
LDINLKSTVGDYSVNVRGRVARIDPGDEPGHLRIGFAFDELDDETRDGIEVLVSRLLESPTSDPFDGLRPDSSALEIRKALEAIPVPRRIALAIRAGPREREYLIHDLHPPVLESLARNPALTAADVSGLLASQFLGSSVLDTLAADHRWARHEEIRMAIASHPRVSLATGERIVSELPSAALRKLLKRPGVNAQLREKVVRKLARD